MPSLFGPELSMTQDSDTAVLREFIPDAFTSLHLWPTRIPGHPGRPTHKLLQADAAARLCRTERSRREEWQLWRLITYQLSEHPSEENSNSLALRLQRGLPVEIGYYSNHTE